MDKQKELHNWEIEAFTDENSEYYIKKWRDNTGIFFGGWNWVAFFFCTEWLAYRRMYVVAALSVIIPLGILLILTSLNLSFGINDKMIADSSKLFFAIFGNGIYRRKLYKMLDKSKGMAPPRKTQFLKQKGGTNLFGMLGFIFVEILVITLIFAI